MEDNETLDPIRLECYRTAREFEHMLGQFADSLPARKRVDRERLRYYAGALVRQLLEGHMAATSEQRRARLTAALESHDYCAGELQRFGMIFTGSAPWRTAAAEILERVGSALRKRIDEEGGQQSEPA